MKIVKHLFFLSIVFFASCSVNQSPVSTEFAEISGEDRLWIEKFFDDFFLSKITIYTLFGSKPMSEIPVCCASKEEWLSNYAKLVEEECPKEEQKQAMIDFKEYLDRYDLPVNWGKWINWKAKHLEPSFLFSKRPTYSDNVFSLYILNVQETAWLLQKRYSVISRELEMEFDPLQVVMEFEDLDSLFWKKVFDSHYVRGILHGFGERNAYFFDRKLRLQDQNTFDLYTHPLLRSSIGKGEDAKDVPLARFRSFSEDILLDPVYQRYLREKEQISNILQGKNQYELIINRLGYQANPQKNEIAFE